MISKADLAPLNDYKTTTTGRVLSVYLDVDQSNTANLNRRFELAFESKLKESPQYFEEDYEQRDFEGCIDEVRKLLAAYEPRARSLVIFARSAGSVWMRELNVAVPTEIHWGTAPHVKSFLEALDEFETYGVVLTDKSHSRIFTVNMGAIQKHADIHAMQSVRHVKSAGTDHLYSQAGLQRRADQHELSHLKRVVQLLDHVSKFTPFDRLVLAGATVATSELFRLLPKPMRARVVASAPLAATATDAQIIAEVLFIGRKAERSRELEKADLLITASAKGKSAVTGLYATLNALNVNRVRELVYAQGFNALGGVCDQCDVVFPSDLMNCEFCDLPVRPAEDLAEAAITKALSEGASIEQVRGDAAEKLRAVGGIGALLRY